MGAPLATADDAQATSSPKATRNTSQDLNGSGQRTPKRGHTSRHQVDVPSDAPRLHGVVVSRQEKFGFIKATENDTRYFFHLRDSDGKANHGAHVTFIVAHDSTASKDVAYDVITTSDRPRTPGGSASKGKEERLPGTFGGVVAAVPRGPAAVRIDDGMIVFTDSAGMQQQALFGSWRVVPGTTPPGLGESVEFGLVKNTATGVYKANNVHLGQNAALAKALASAQAAMEGLALGACSPKQSGSPSASSLSARSPLARSPATHGSPANHSSPATNPLSPLAPSQNTPASPANSANSRQLGRVALLKKEFGFIRQVTRPGDLFFHFSHLEDIDPADIKVGDDVEFTVRRDRDGKLSAQGVRRAAPGAVVFDEITDAVLQGVVLEKPVVTKQYVQSSGVLEYSPTLSENNGATNGGAATPRSATASSATNGSTSSTAPKQRIVFAATDCVGGASSLRPGDYVSFKIATNIAAAVAAVQATVPGAAQLAGRRAVEVTPVHCKGVVASVHSERKFGFIVTSHVNETPRHSDTNHHWASAAAAEGLSRAEGGLATPKCFSQASSLEIPIENNEPVPASPMVPVSPMVPASPFHFGEKKSRRVFFHFSEVNGGLVLRAGDEVSFVLHSNLKTGELNAARVKCTKASPETPVRHSTNSSSNKEPTEARTPTARTPTQNPNKLKLTGNLQSGEHKTQYQPKMPDGTKGFTFERTRGLDAAAAEVSSMAPFAFFAGLPLKGMGRSFSGLLSVGAKPFIPRVDSAASLKSLKTTLD